MAINVFIKATFSIRTNERNQEQHGPAAEPAGPAVPDSREGCAPVPGFGGQPPHGSTCSPLAADPCPAISTLKHTRLRATENTG